MIVQGSRTELLEVGLGPSITWIEHERVAPEAFGLLGGPPGKGADALVDEFFRR